MPMLTESQMDKVHSIVSTAQRAKERTREELAARKEEIRLVGEAVGASVVLQFVRGKMEDSTGAWNIPGTQVDIEGVVGLGMLGLGLSRKAGKHSQDLINGSVGVLSHYMGQLSRHFSKTGSFSLVAGTSPGSLVGS